jgi:hypothetical protein
VNLTITADQIYLSELDSSKVDIYISMNYR